MRYRGNDGRMNERKNGTMGQPKNIMTLPAQLGSEVMIISPKKNYYIAEMKWKKEKSKKTVQDNNLTQEHYTVMEQGSMTQNQHTKKITKAKFSRLLWHPTWKRSVIILAEWEGMEKQENRLSE